MNLFPTSRNPVATPRDLADRHVRTQIGDLSIMLATALLVMYPEDQENLRRELGPEVVGELEHHCVQWCAFSLANWSWAWLQLDALHGEYQHRNGTSHPLRGRVLLLLEFVARGDPDQETQVRVLGLVSPPSSFPRSKAGRATGLENAQASARQELAWRYSQWNTKGRPPKWTNRTRPEWLSEAFTYRSR